MLQRSNNYKTMKVSESKLKKMLSNLFKVAPEDINDDTSMDTIEKWDSLNHLNLILALESEFNVILTEENTVEVISYPLIKIVLQEHGLQFTA
jgi:acyl carrier protein